MRGRSTPPIYTFRAKRSTAYHHSNFSNRQSSSRDHTIQYTLFHACMHACMHASINQSINQSIHYRTFDCCCVMDLFLRAQINNRLRPLNLFSNIIVNIGGVMTFPLHLKESTNAGNTSSTVIYLSMQIAVAVVVTTALITVLAFLFGVCIFFLHVCITDTLNFMLNA